MENMDDYKNTNLRYWRSIVADCAILTFGAMGFMFVSGTAFTLLVTRGFKWLAFIICLVSFIIAFCCLLLLISTVKWNEEKWNRDYKSLSNKTLMEREVLRETSLKRKDIRVRDIEMHSQCPTCGGILYEEANIIFNYCPWCAQALNNNDFSEEE